MKAWPKMTSLPMKRKRMIFSSDKTIYYVLWSIWRKTWWKYCYVCHRYIFHLITHFDMQIIVVIWVNMQISQWPHLETFLAVFPWKYFKDSHAKAWGKAFSVCLWALHKLTFLSLLSHPFSGSGWCVSPSSPISCLTTWCWSSSSPTASLWL